MSYALRVQERSNLLLDTYSVRISARQSRKGKYDKVTMAILCLLLNYGDSKDVLSFIKEQKSLDLLHETFKNETPISVSRKRNILDKKLTYYDDDTLIKALNILINKEMITKELLVFVNKFNLG